MGQGFGCGSKLGCGNASMVGENGGWMGLEAWQITSKKTVVEIEKE